MPRPAAFNDLPLGWIRMAVSAGRQVGIVDSGLPLAKHVETMKLAETMSAAGQAKRYWVFSFPAALHDKTGRNYSVTGALPVVKGAGFDSYDDAESQYDTWARGDAGKNAVKRGHAGLKHIGTAD